MATETLEHHTISYDTIKGKSKDASISMMRKNGSILECLNSIEKDLKNIIGHYGISLLYIICGYEKPPNVETDSDEFTCIKDKALRLVL